MHRGSTALLLRVYSEIDMGEGQRTWLTSTLGTIPQLLELVQAEDMYQGESVLNANIRKPFLVFNFGNRTSEDISEELPGVSRQFLTIFIHDVPADYSRVDQIETALIYGLNQANSEPDAIITTRYLETSRDLDDQALGTIYRYVRLQLIRSR
jgi:hypothetical protein